MHIQDSSAGIRTRRTIRDRYSLHPRIQYNVSVWKWSKNRDFPMITLDDTISIWLISLLGFLAGILAGSIVTYLLVARNRRTHELQLELNQLTERFTEYRDQVTQHFMRTSELVQEMTRSYRDVYEHLASGAQNLCGDTEERWRLDQREAAEQLADESDQDAARETVDDTADYDELEELSSIRRDLDELLGESPRISDLDIRHDIDAKKPLQH
jgi:uncharacterized membrane-anchored protein YhcB (DUF1043 family)